LTRPATFTRVPFPKTGYELRTDANPASSAFRLASNAFGGIAAAKAFAAH
jgi:hypothetical protein